MTRLRALLFGTAFVAWFVIMALLMLPLMLGPRRWLMSGLRVFGLGLIVILRVICGVRVEVRGREHIPQGAALIAPKHQCAFDVFGSFVWLRDSCFVMKKELVWTPFLGMYAVKAGMIIVDRQGHSSAVRKLIRDAKDRFRHQRQLVIFPEGTRTEPGAPADYKPGIAGLYRELDLPVHPVATNAGVHWPAHGFPGKPGTIVFEYLEPIPPGLKRAEFMRLLEERIETASTKLLSL